MYNRRSESLPFIIPVAKEQKGGKGRGMQKKLRISGSTLKLIALISMLMDHTAAVVFPCLMIKHEVYCIDFSVEYASMALSQGGAGWLYILYQVMRRGIGRLAFPVYCFLLVEGFERTRSRARYACRLFLFALISEVPFDLAFHARSVFVYYQNVFFTLLLGFLMMWAMKALEERALMPLLRWAGTGFAFLAAAFAAEAIYCDYGANGITAIALLYLFRKNKWRQIFAGIIAFLWEITAPLAFLFIGLYDGKRGLRLKYVFYLFYPLHLLILYYISTLLL